MPPSYTNMRILKTDCFAYALTWLSVRRKNLRTIASFFYRYYPFVTSSPGCFYLLFFPQTFPCQVGGGVFIKRTFLETALLIVRSYTLPNP